MAISNNSTLAAKSGNSSKGEGKFRDSGSKNILASSGVSMPRLINNWLIMGEIFIKFANVKLASGFVAAICQR